MAHKRAAPPPPVESSVETNSGSGSEDSEEEIAYSPGAAPMNTTPPPKKLKQPEAFDDDEEEEEEDEDEEEDNANHVASSDATANSLSKLDKSDSDEEEEDETDDEAPQPVSPPEHDAVENGKIPASSGEDKKPAAPFQRVWSKDDDVRILEALVAHRRQHGKLPQPEDLEAALAGSLENSGHSTKELMTKVKSLKTRHTKIVNRGDRPSTDVDRQIFVLAKEAWGIGDKTSNGAAPKEFDEMCRMYPYLAEEIKFLEETDPGLFKTKFCMIDDEKARVMDQKIRKQRMLQMKLEMRRCDVKKEVTKTLMELME